MFFRFDKISQVALVVKDLHKSIKSLWEDLGIGPWKIWTLTPENTETILHGRRCKSSFRVGIAKIGDISFELVQPFGGESIVQEFLDKRGEGLHHLKYAVENPETILENFKKEGVLILQSGKIGDSSFYYLDTESKFGFILELSTGQALRMKPPDELYPPD
ncbi:VOC family protein [Candidatus Bathyarchaeota archaeon]|nr:VOC family protein [Candidatus Bathyarchaeota archaeon]